MENKSHLLEGLLLGGLIGIGLGIMFAPQAGESLRAKLKEKFRELDLNEIVDRFSEAFEEGTAEAEKVLSETER